ncbi:MAG: class I SAM-dependent methyltransferase [Deltaproteobacteria bacterium]|nr:class I SAM-dependent methyltransferase [Deltaproteobacteria bacterium]
MKIAGADDLDRNTRRISLSRGERLGLQRASVPVERALSVKRDGSRGCLYSKITGGVQSVPAEVTQDMKRDEDLIEQINSLWLPVYPFMAEHALAVSGLGSGKVLDLGPFAGGIAVSILARSAGFQAKVVDESERVLRSASQWAGEKGCSARLIVQCAPIDAIHEPDGSFDLVTLRGAFFFLTPLLLREVKRVLHPGGFGWVGGGYGPLTPSAVIAPIADRSRRLNEDLGRRRITAAECKELLLSTGLAPWATISTDGGLWIEVRG